MLITFALDYIILRPLLDRFYVIFFTKKIDARRVF